MLWKNRGLKAADSDRASNCPAAQEPYTAIESHSRKLASARARMGVAEFLRQNKELPLCSRAVVMIFGDGHCLRVEMIGVFRRRGVAGRRSNQTRTWGAGGLMLVANIKRPLLGRSVLVLNERRDECFT